MDTTPAPAEPVTERRSGRPRFWAEISGALAVGLAALAAVVVVFQILAWIGGLPGPGLLTVAGHLVATALAVLAQRFADRHRGWPGMVAVLAVLVVTAATLWLYWWQ
jgi:hypothetical protein